MLIMRQFNSSSAAKLSRRGFRQRGASLLVAIMVLIAMTLSAVGLMRSMFTSNRIAGNLSFQQSATQSAEAGVENAVAWLEANNAAGRLNENIDIGGTETHAYFASRVDEPAPGQSWEQYWTATLVPTGRINELAEDAAGNQVSYVIQRLCAAVGPPSGSGCAISPVAGLNDGNSNQSGSVAIASNPQRYYRITVRVQGPRNTLSFVQSTVAM